jgi:hypothetical protein
MGLCKERSLLKVERPHWDAVVTATPNMLQNLWTEFGHSMDICRVSRGTGVEVN